MGEQITIQQGAVWARIISSAVVRMELAAALEFEVPGAKYMQKFKSGLWNGKISLVHRGTGAFPAGLAERVAALLREDGHQVQIRTAGGGQAEGARDVKLVGIEMRTYQQAVVERALRSGRAFIMSPTGSGKTEMGAALVQVLKRPTLWICHRATLMRQTAERLSQRLGQHVGMIGDNITDVRPVTVGMVPSLHGKFPAEWWPQWDVMVLDECHHTGATTWLAVANMCSRAYWRFGLSATPLTGKPLRDLQLEGATGPILVAETHERLVEAGFLAKPHIVMLRPPAASYPTYEQVRAAVLPDWRDDPIRLQKLGGKLYAEAYDRGIVHNRARTNLLAETVASHVRAGERVMMLCTRLDHGDILIQSCQAHCEPHTPMWWLSGEEKGEDREYPLQEFRAAEGGAVLVASTIFDEGVDIPEIDVLVLAGGGESEMRTVQRVGRALRPRPDKSTVLIYDVQDGRAVGAKKDYLAQHSAAREQVYKDQGYEVEEVW